MTTEENKALVRRVLAAVRHGNGRRGFGPRSPTRTPRWRMLAERDRVAYRVTVSFFAIVRVADGKLVEEWGGLDQVDMLRQLRAPGEPAPA
jgi:hypothetical protein